mgnify:CR=1 FL=1
MESIYSSKIIKELQKIDKEAANAYIGALIVLEDKENPDRFSQAAHSLREVTAIISRKVSIPQEIKKEFCLDKKKESLKEKLERKFVEKPELIPFPAADEVKKLIGKWDELNRYFTAVSHHGKHTTDEEFASKLSEFKAILLYFLRPAPEVIEELDQLLKIQTPSDKDIEKLKELLRHPTYVRYFFPKLSSPDWLIPLKEQGFFSKSPSGIKEGGYVIFPDWPLTKYLIKIAKNKPREVMEIIKEMEKTDNFRVHIDLIDCAIQMPSSIAKEIVPFIKDWVDTPYLTLLPEKIGELAVKLIHEGETDAALETLDILFDVKSGKDILNETQPFFDLWQYSQILNKIAPEFLQKEPCKFVEILCEKLQKSIKLEMKTENFYDASYTWRPAIEEHAQNMDNKDVKNLLVTSIRDRLEVLAESNSKVFKKCFKLLSNYKYSIFRRIELYLMMRFPELLRDEILKVFSDKKVFEDIHLWHEYYHLLQTQFSKLPQDIKDKILSWIGEKEESSQLRYLSAIKDDIPPKWKKIWNKLVAKYGEPEHPDFHFYTESFAGPTSPLTSDEMKKMNSKEIIDYLKRWNPPKGIFKPSREGLGRVLREVVSKRPSEFAKVCEDFKDLPSVYIYYLLDGFREAVKKEYKIEWEPIIQFCKDVLLSPPEESYTLEEDGYYNLKSVKGAIADLLEEGLKSKNLSPPYELKDTIWKIIVTLLQDDEPSLEYEEKYGGDNMDPVTLSLNTVRGKAMHTLIQYALWCARCLNLSESKDKMVPEVKRKLEEMLNPDIEPTLTVRAVYGLYLPTLIYLNRNWTKNNLQKIFPKNPRKLWRAAWEAYICYFKFDDDAYQILRSEYENAINKLQSPKISVEAKHRLSEHIVRAYLRELEDIEKESLVKQFFEKAEPRIRGHAVWFVGQILKDLSNVGLSDQKKGKIIERLKNLYEWRLREVKKKINKAKGKKEKMKSRDNAIEELKWFGLWFINNQNQISKDWMISKLNETLEVTNGVIEFASEIVERLEDYLEEYCLEVLKTLNLLIKADNQDWFLISSKETIKKLLIHTTETCSVEEIKDSINETISNLVRKGYYEFSNLYIK